MEQLSLAEFREREGVLSKLPFLFGNGAELLTLEGSCSLCRKPVQELRGDVVPVLDETYRAARAKFYYFDVLGYCPPCNLLTPFRYGVTDKLELVAIRNGFLEIYGRPPWRHRFMKRVTQLFRARES